MPHILASKATYRADGESLEDDMYYEESYYYEYG